MWNVEAPAVKQQLRISLQPFLSQLTAAHVCCLCASFARDFFTVSFFFTSLAENFSSNFRPASQKILFLPRKLW
jgi:hypothetical protein